MKEQITKFDLADAFKALDDLAAPAVKGVRPNKMDLKESVKRVDRLSMLVEDYYNVQDQDELEQADADMQADVAKAKLAKIEKIVDLDAETPEDIQPSYVGKTIIQCPQCMTLFYKDPADIEKSEDPEIVNIGEICQHCGNDTGYMIIGKVAEEEPEELPTEEMPAMEEPVEEIPAEEELPVEDEIPAEEATEEELPEVEAEEEPEEEKKEESLHKAKINKDVDKKHCSEHDSENLTLNEEASEKYEIKAINANVQKIIDKVKAYMEKTGCSQKKAIEVCCNEKDKFLLSNVETEDGKIINALALDEDLDKDLAQFNDYIDYLQNMLKQDEEALEKAKKMKDNDLAIAAIERRIEADKADLDAALPQIVKDKQNEDELPTMEEAEAQEEAAEEIADEEVVKESVNKAEINKTVDKKHCSDFDSENLTLNEETELKEYKTAKKYNTYTEITWALAGGKPYKAPGGGTAISGGPYEIEDIGVDPKTNTIKVYAESEAALQPAIEIANKFGKEVSDIQFDKYAAGDKKHFLRIQLIPEDYEDGEFEDDFGESVNKAEINKTVDKKHCSEHDSENLTLNEEEVEDKPVTDTQIDKLLDSKEYDTPISDKEVLGYLKQGLTNNKKESLDEFDKATDIDDEALNECISNYLTEVYSNVDNFKATNCDLTENTIILEGTINFKSGKQKPTKFELTHKNNMLEGFNETLGGKDSKFKINYTIKSGCTLLPESLSYSYKIGENLVEGLIKK